MLITAELPVCLRLGGAPLEGGRALSVEPAFLELGPILRGVDSFSL